MRDATEIYYTAIFATVFFVVLVTIVVMAIGRYYARKRTHEMSLLHFDHTLLQTRLEIQEQTFKTISQELHDNIGQLLTLAKLHMNTLSLDNREQASEKLNGAIDLVSHSIQSIRDLSRNLHAETIQRTGLIGALETEVRLIQKLQTIQPIFQVSGTPKETSESKSLIIFRIVQEALHNVMKHSGATVVEMNVNYMPEDLVISVKDNGKGFDARGGHEGSGLRNMRDRAAVIGAELTIRTTADEGTNVTLTIPQHEQNNSSRAGG